MNRKIIENYLAATPYGSFELKDELRFRAEKAVECGELVEIYGEMILFKPDDGSLEKHSEKDVRKYIEATGFDDLVSRLIEDKFLRERLAGRFPAIVVEEEVLVRIKTAIENGNIDEVVKDFSVTYYDRGRKICSIDEETMVEKLKKAGAWDFVRYKVWLKKNTLSI